MLKLVFALLLLPSCAPHLPARARIAAITSSASLAEEPAVELLGWLGGCWEARSGPSTVEEYWSSPRGGSLIGLSRTVRADITTTHEMMLIRAVGGRLNFEVLPHGQPRTLFVLVALGGSSVVFENPAHDFPQRISYRRTETDSLIAQIEGTINGRERVVRFPYARTLCPGA